ncbi:MAG: tetratricopeptide repeat protein [Myxococcales bacterium]|nr:tetratricopeptide repeat protein [Myxococcales bacterium]
MRRARVGLIIAAVVGLAPGMVTAEGAEPPPSDADWAEAGELFHQGRKLMEKPATLDRACELLATSYEKRPRGDTLLNLAECHRRQGKTATAWREFDEAIRYAKEVEFAEAITAAEKLRDELAKNLSGLMVEVEDPPPELRVVLDQKPLPKQQWGVPLFVDPGPHTVWAVANGYERFEDSIEVQRQGDRAVIRVRLKKLPSKPLAPEPKPPPPPPPPPSSELPIWAVVVGSSGIAMIAVSIGLGVDTVNAGGELDDLCGEARNTCPSDYDFMATRERELTSFGLFVGFGVGGLLATGAGALGLGLGLTGSPATTAVSPWFGPSGGGVSVAVDF